MFDLQKLCREDLQHLQPYKPNPVAEGILKLDANESPFDLPLAIKAEIQSLIGQELYNRYPDPQAERMIGAIAQYVGLNPEQLIAGNGSDELILNLMLCFGKMVLAAVPTFSMYRIHAQIAQARFLGVDRKANYEVDFELLLEEAKRTSASLIFICSPNNPTGNAVEKAKVEKLLTETEALVVIDEAYIEFGGESCISLLEQYPNLIILRTFSKAFGLAGMRVGYLAADPTVIQELQRIKQPFNINNYSQIAVYAALQHQDLIEQQVRIIQSGRDELQLQMQQLAMMGIKTYPSSANFILFEAYQEAGELSEALRQRGVLIRNISGRGLENCLRVTVGTPEQNTAFLEALVESISEL